ncbi:MAG TPA: addiction module protein [Verrucomicrobiae bacterium]|nr:addiction module protein [Verrucomicrobiae bacterium]
MALTIEGLTEDAPHLREDKRLTLAHRILASVEPPATPEIKAAGDEGIRQRMENSQKGLSKTTPAKEVFAEVEARLRR